MKKEYEQIPGLGTGRGSFQVGMRSRLYQGLDHLLLVQSTGYTEDYRRVFYRDIRYVIARKSSRYFWSNIIFGTLTAGFLLLHLAGAPWAVVAFLAMFSGICLILNLARGVTCECSVNTDVQTLIVPTPQRMKKVPILIDFLKTKVPSLESETATF